MKSIQDPVTSGSAKQADVLERLFELAVRLADGMDRGLAERGLTRARAELLWRLGQGEGGMTQRDLSVVLQCTPRNVTGLVDALEAGGYVVRAPHPTDRRATVVTLSGRGAAAARSMGEEYARAADGIFADLSADEVEVFAVLLGRILARLAPVPRQA